MHRYPIDKWSSMQIAFGHSHSFLGLSDLDNNCVYVFTTTTRS
jgi:hypothetical protein